MKIKDIFKNKTIRNIASDIDSDELRKIGQDVYSGFEEDKAAKSGREDTQERAMKLAMQVIERKDFPWKGSSNVKYPLITNASLEFGAKIYPVIIKDGRVAEGKIYGPDQIEVFGPKDPQTGQNTVEKKQLGKSEKANNIADLLNFQLMEKMLGWEEDMDKLCTMLPTLGCMFKKVYWDPIKESPESIMVLPNDIFVRYDCRSIEESPRITHRYELTANEIEKKIRNGVFIETEISEEGDGGIQPSATLNDDLKERQTGDEHMILEQHTWLDLDDDGYKEPYIVTIVGESKEVLSILPRFTEEDVIMNGKEIKCIYPMNHFVAYSFLPSQDGSIYGAGFGELLYPLNESVNTVINQLLDSGTLSNVKGGFISGDFRMKSGNSMKLAPGEFKVLPGGSGQGIRNNLVQVDFGEPSMVLFQLLGSLIEAGRSVASIKDMDLQANTAPTTALALIEQGLTNFKAIYKRIHRALKKELNLIMKLNSVFLSDEQYIKIVPQGKGSDLKDDGYGVTPVSDPAQVSNTQKMIRAQALMGIESPFIDQKKRLQEYLESIGYQDAEDMMQEPPQQGPDPLVQAQLMQLQASVQLLQEQIKSAQFANKVAASKESRETAKTMSEIANNRIKTEADTTKTLADAVKALSEEEKNRPGDQTAQDINTFDQLKGSLNEDDSEGMGEMEETSSNPAANERMEEQSESSGQATTEQIV